MRLLGRQFENLGVFKSSYLLIANPRNIHTVLCSQEKLFITNIIAGLPIISKIHHYLGPRNPVLACSNVSYLEYAGIRLSMVLGNTQTLRILQLCYPEVEKTCPRYWERKKGQIMHHMVTVRHNWSLLDCKHPANTKNVWMRIQVKCYIGNPRKKVMRQFPVRSLQLNGVVEKQFLVHCWVSLELQDSK